MLETISMQTSKETVDILGLPLWPFFKITFIKVEKDRQRRCDLKYIDIDIDVLFNKFAFIWGTSYILYISLFEQLTQTQDN